jgi:predicted aspartyl protease
LTHLRRPLIAFAGLLVSLMPPVAAELVAAIGSTVPQPAKPTEIAVPVSLEAGAVIIDASIDGRGPFPLMFDTGARNSLTPEAAAALGLVTEAAGTVLDSGDRSVAAPLTRVGKLRLGDAEMTDQPFTIIALPPYLTDRGARTPLAGMLGVELLERFAVRLDYGARTLTLQPAANFRFTGDGFRLPLVPIENIVAVPAAADGISGMFVVDTGSTGALTLRRDFVEARGLEASHPSALHIKSIGADGPFEALLTRLDRFDIGDSRIDSPATRIPATGQARVGAADFAGAIGYEILRQFIITFDYGHGEVWFERSAAFGAPTGRASAGFQAIGAGGAGFRVMTVLPNTAAAAAGLRSGDLITAVDGTSVVSMTLGEFAELISRPEGTRVWLGVVRDGTEQRVALTLRQVLPAALQGRSQSGVNSK